MGVGKALFLAIEDEVSEVNKPVASIFSHKSHV
jgi:hypothetical protein